MNVYMYDFSRDSYTLDELAPFLGEQRYAYCRRFKVESAALRSAYAFMLLRIALKREHGISRVPQFAFNEHDKPFLAEYPDIYFSMSHCVNTVLCAVADTPVGADIQDVRRLSLRTAAKFLTDEEYSKVYAISDENVRNEESCRLWCIKESYGKMTGKGFGEGFSGFSAERLIAEGTALCTKRKDMFISVCVRNEGEK